MKMEMKLFKRFAGIILVSALGLTALTAQDRNAVIAAFNEGAKLTKTDVPGAIKAFENTITIADQVGETAADLKQKAAGALPGLYLRAAQAAISEKKPAPEIMKAAKTAVAKADQYGTQTHKENASKMLVRAYNTLANSYFSQNDYPNTIMAFDSLLAINPGYVNAIYNKALVQIKQNDAAGFESTIDNYLEKVKAVNDTVKVKQASRLALEFFRSNGSEANQADNLDEAITTLDKAAKYGDDKDLFYFYADVYNKKKNFDKGIEYARKGLALETGAAEAQARFHYQLAVGQAGKGQNNDACASFKKAMYGPFAEASKAQSKNLKCQ